MKPSQDIKLKIEPGPELSRRIAAGATAALSDEEAVVRAAELQALLAPEMAYVQELYLAGARSEHDNSDEKRLVAEHGAAVEEAIRAACEALSAKTGEVTVLDDKTLALLPRILCASELLVYPCMEFSGTLSAREIVYYGEGLADALEAAGPGNHPPLTRDYLEALRRLSREDIFALRMATDEYLVQARIFELLDGYCRAVSSRLGALGAQDAALEALGLVQILARRADGYWGCLPAQDAAAFAEGLKSVLSRMRRETGNPASSRRDG